MTKAIEEVKTKEIISRNDVPVAIMGKYCKSIWDNADLQDELSLNQALQDIKDIGTSDKYLGDIDFCIKNFNRLSNMFDCKKRSMSSKKLSILYLLLGLIGGAYIRMFMLKFSHGVIMLILSALLVGLLNIPGKIVVYGASLVVLFRDMKLWQKFYDGCMMYEELAARNLVFHPQLNELSFKYANRDMFLNNGKGWFYLPLIVYLALIFML